MNLRHRCHIVLLAVLLGGSGSCVDMLTRCLGGDDHGASFHARFSDSSTTKTFYVGDTATVLATYWPAYHGDDCQPAGVESANVPDAFHATSFDTAVVTVDGLLITARQPGQTSVYVTVDKYGGCVVAVVNARP
jgi:hypothetical protein